ncbi:MAG: glycosyltransferase, partial [Acidimicrobiales bacterium]
MLASRAESRVPQRLRPSLIWCYDRSRRGYRLLARSQLGTRIRGLTPTRLKLPDDHETVTVVVPCFNEQRFIADCLKSLIRQSYKDWRCIVVDDASTDNSVSIATRMAAKDSRIQVVRHKRNSGLSASRNTGLRLAETSLITFLDADDLILAESLADRICTLEANKDPAVAGVYCGAIRATEDVTLRSYPSKLTWDPPEFADFLSTGGECPFVAHAPLLKTEILRRAGGFDERMLHGAEDWDLWLRLMRNGYVFRSSNYRTVVYRMKRSSMVRATPLNHLSEATRLLASPAEVLVSEHIIKDAPEVLNLPLSHYEVGVRQNKRILEFCGLANESGDKKLDEAIAMLDASSWTLLKRHHDLTQLVDSGIRRAKCADASSPDASETVVAPIRERILSKAEKWSLKQSDDPKSASVDSVDVLLAPSTAAQVNTMLEL